MEKTLIWKLKSVDFDELKQGLDESTLKYIGDVHCKLCVLASGPMCMKRSICRASKNEVYVNVSIEEDE